MTERFIGKWADRGFATFAALLFIGFVNEATLKSPLVMTISIGGIIAIATIGVLWILIRAWR